MIYLSVGIRAFYCTISFPRKGKVYDGPVYGRPLSTFLKILHLPRPSQWLSSCMKSSGRRGMATEPKMWITGRSHGGRVSLVGQAGSRV